MAKWEDRVDCPGCGEKHAVEGTLAEGRCTKCTWNAGMMRRISAASCPGCGGRVEPLDKEAKAATGRQAICVECHREPIEYIRLQAGMELRDQLAAAALPAIISNLGGYYHTGYKEIVENGKSAFRINDNVVEGAYKLADAMMAERKKGGKE